MNLELTLPNAATREDNLREEQILREAWEEACLPVRDDRAEVLLWAEERKLETRNALIEHRKRFSQNGGYRVSPGSPLLKLLARWVHTSSASTPSPLRR